jgi:hypothetical protein
MSAILVDGSELCYCGKRRGQHRYMDECCPNPRWECGNGQPQWWEHRRFVALPQLDSPLICWGLSSFCAETGHKCRAARECVYAPPPPVAAQPERGGGTPERIERGLR